MAESRLSSLSNMMSSSLLMSFQDSMMGELLLGLVMRNPRPVSVMRRSFDDIMRLGRLVKTKDGLCGREYSTILCRSILMISIVVRVLEVSMR
jgi:hypothetical protein